MAGEISAAGKPRVTAFESNASVLDSEEAMVSTYRGTCEYVEAGTKQDIRLRCLQGWFFRSSWSEKFCFVREICELTTGVYVLEKVLKCLESIFTKDVIDSFGRDRIAFPYDVIPTDDNRSMKEEELAQVRQQDILWFVNLEPSAQTKAIVELLRLGGGGLIFSVYKEIDRLYRERREMNMVLAAVETSIRELMEERNEMEEDKEEESKSEESKIGIELEEHMARRKAELEAFAKKYGLSNVGKKPIATEVLDHVQMLPIWLNRKIMLQLTDGDLGELKRLGKYWTRMIEEAVYERAGRVAIDETIERIGGCGGSRPEDTPEETEEVPVLGREALLAELGLRHSDLVRIQKNNRSAKNLNMEVSYWEKFCFDGIVCSVSETCKILAASTANRCIGFYSLRTGKRMANMVTSIPSNITSMAVHDEGFHVIVGCEDGSLYCMNIRKNERTITYKGHSGPVLRIHSSDEKFVSAAEDRTIKHFDLWSGLCLFCVHVDDSIASMIVLKRRWRTAIAGTAQGKLVFIDLGKKKIYREVVVHERKVKGIAEVGSLLVTHSADSTIRIWSVNHLEEGNCGVITPFASIRLKSVATVVECLGNEIFAACADGKVRLICKLTGAAKRVVEVTQKKPIAGIYVMQEKDTTKMIMWHEGGIEMRSFSDGKASRKKKKTGESAPPGRDAVPISRKKFLTILPYQTCVNLRSPRRTIKRYRVRRVQDLEMIQMDRSCTARRVREVTGKEVVTAYGDVFLRTMGSFQGAEELTTFSRLRSKDVPRSVMPVFSFDFTDEFSLT